MENSPTITGRSRNTSSGAYSSILGGSGNNDGGFNWAGIFGCNIGGQADKTFHVNCLNACDTPLAAIGLPSGTIAKVVGGFIPPGALPLVIMP